MSKIEDFLSKFKKAQVEMIAKNDAEWKGGYWGRHHEYTPEEVQEILNSNDPYKMAALSRDFFFRSGLYRRILLYYASLLTYSGLLVPIGKAGNKLSNTGTTKKYDAALSYLEKMRVKEILTRITTKVLVNGSYAGFIAALDKKEFVLIDLPHTYCKSRYRDIHGNDLIEFDVNYFSSIVNEEDRLKLIAAYPKVISDYYKKYITGKVSSSWVILPAEFGIYFSLTDDVIPFFINVIPATIQYDDAVDNERERELEEIRKIIVQKIPHLQDGTLLFEPDEALEMHAGAVGMMRGNKNLSILTTYADVEAIVSKTSSDNLNNTLEKMLQNVYSEAGASVQIFSPTGTQALSTSIINDTSLMMILGNKYSSFITYILNKLFSNATLEFKYEILSLTLYNQSDYIKDSFKLAQSGYSFILPAIASGISQLEFTNLKSLENDVLKLQEVLLPLSSAYTQSTGSGEVGAPAKKVEDKSPKTLQNEESLDHQGGSGE